MTIDNTPFQFAIPLVNPVRTADFEGSGFRVSATIEFDPLDLVIGRLLHEAANMTFEEFLNADFRFVAFAGATSSEDLIVRAECRAWLRRWGTTPTVRAAIESFRETRAMVAIEWDHATWDWIRTIARPVKSSRAV